MALQNYITSFSPRGKIGEILSANEKVWIHELFNDNPALFSGFSNKDDDSIVKTMWHGEFPGKLLTGIAKTYLLNNNSKTKSIGDKIVENLKKVQEENGYLGPWKESIRFDLDTTKNPDIMGKWDTWGHFHCIYGLLRWYQATKNEDALSVAIKAADCVYNYFIVGNRRIAHQKWAECNLAIGYAFACLYEEIGDEKYLVAAEHIVREDWKIEYKDFYTGNTVSCNWMQTALSGKSYYESGQPRWEGLYALETLSALYRITKKRDYLNATESLWWGMVNFDRHNTGSFGTGEGASGNLYGAGSETCNTCAWMAFSTEYLRISKNSYVADELELSFYNAALGSLLEGERNFTYMNDSDGKREAARITLEGQSYTGGRDMSCCQANGNSGISQITDWALLTDNDGLYLNYYGASAITTNLADGTEVTLTQSTDYPRTDTVLITVESETEKDFTLYLRIPTWSKKTFVTVNKEEIIEADTGKYLPITRNWKQGDSIKIRFDMGFHFWVKDCEEADSKLSVYYGPVLLAFCPYDNLATTTNFPFESLKNSILTDTDALVSFKVAMPNGSHTELTDYYSAGKSGNSYISWITCESGVDALKSNSKKTPIWCKR